MKKLSIFLVLSLLVLLSSSALAEEGSIHFGASYDLGGSLNWQSTTYGISPGYTFNGEITMPYHNNMSLGLGAAYQLPRSLQNNANAQFNFIPFYGLLKFYTDNEGYLVGKLGYNMLQSNDDFDAANDLNGGIYYGVGVGSHSESMNVEIMYSVNNGTKENYFLSYSKLSFSLSVGF